MIFYCFSWLLKERHFQKEKRNRHKRSELAPRRHWKGFGLRGQHKKDGVCHRATTITGYSFECCLYRRQQHQLAAGYRSAKIGQKEFFSVSSYTRKKGGDFRPITFCIQRACCYYSRRRRLNGSDDGVRVDGGVVIHMYRPILCHLKGAYVIK